MSRSPARCGSTPLGGAVGHTRHFDPSPFAIADVICASSGWVLTNFQHGLCILDLLTVWQGELTPAAHANVKRLSLPSIACEW